MFLRFICSQNLFNFQMAGFMIQTIQSFYLKNSQNNLLFVSEITYEKKLGAKTTTLPSTTTRRACYPILGIMFH